MDWTGLSIQRFNISLYQFEVMLFKPEPAKTQPSRDSISIFSHATLISAPFAVQNTPPSAARAHSKSVCHYSSSKIILNSLQVTNFENSLESECEHKKCDSEEQLKDMTVRHYQYPPQCLFSLMVRQYHEEHHLPFPEDAPLSGRRLYRKLGRKPNRKPDQRPNRRESLEKSLRFEFSLEVKRLNRIGET